MSSDEARSLLIVDDEARILSALRRTLRHEGYKILTAETVEEAFQILDERPVDAILSDIKMPVMNGSEFLREAARRCPNAVRMIITGWTEEIPPSQLESLGVCALVTKPWDDDKLKATLRRALAL